MGAESVRNYPFAMPSTIDDPQIAPFSKFQQLTADIHVAMLTTRDAEGQLHSRPMGTRKVETDGALWFFTADDSGKVREIYHDQKVNVSYAEPKKQIYVSVSGQATLVRDREKIRELWTPILKTWFPDGPDSAHLALLRVDIQGIDYWEGPGKMITLLKFAKNAVSETPAKIGRHGRVEPVGSDRISRIAGAKRARPGR